MRKSLQSHRLTQRFSVRQTEMTVVLALPMLYIFGCGLYTLYCREWLQFLILLVAEFGCFVLIFMGTLVADAAERFSGWVAEL